MRGCNKMEQRMLHGLSLIAAVGLAFLPSLHAHAQGTNNPVPKIISVKPNQLIAGSGDADLEITGANFVPDSMAAAGPRMPLKTEFVDSKTIRVKAPAKYIGGTGKLNITVMNPAPGGGDSNVVPVSIVYPKPVVTGCDPAEIERLSTQAKVTVSGEALLPSTQYFLNGTPAKLNSLDSGKAVLLVPAAVTALPKSISVEVRNPAPGGGSAKAACVVVRNPPLQVVSGTPNELVLNTPRPIITLELKGVVPETIALVGTQKATLQRSGSKTVATLPAAAIAKAGPSTLIIKNSPGGESTEFAFTVINPAPVVTSVFPNRVERGARNTLIEVNGSGFVNGSRIYAAATELAAKYAGPNKLTAVLPPDLTASAGDLELKVVTDSPGGGSSGGKPITVFNPRPELSAINPSSVQPESPSAQIKLSGSGFVSESQAAVDGKNFPLTVLSSTSAQFDLGADDLLQGRIAKISVTSPAPGGGSSRTVELAIRHPIPTLTAIEPSTVSMGKQDIQLPVTGKGFAEAIKAFINTTELKVKRDSRENLTVTIPAALLRAAGALPIRLRNPEPGGGEGAPKNLQVVHPVPVVSSVTPDSGKLRAAAETITITGDGFVNGASILVEGKPAVTVWLAENKVKATLGPEWTRTAGALELKVKNPGPGGGVSEGGVRFEVRNPPAQLTGLNPAQAIMETTPFKLILEGKDFVPGAVIKVDGQEYKPSSMTDTRAEISLPVEVLRTAGARKVEIANPGPGGGGSGARDLTLVPAKPVLLSIKPEQAERGSSSMDITLSASGMNSGTEILAGNDVVAAIRRHAAGKSINPSSGEIALADNAGQVVVRIPGRLLANAGPVEIRLRNPAPGGSSEPRKLMVGNPKPELKSVQPQNVVAEEPVTLRLTGAGFVSETQVLVADKEVTPQVLNRNEMIVNIPRNFISAAGKLPVQVRNPAPNGGESDKIDIQSAFRIRTIAGQDGGGGTADRVDAQMAAIRYPTDVALDANGAIYFTDTTGNLVRRIDAGSNKVMTIAGNGKPGFMGDGSPARESAVKYPNAVTVDYIGNVYIADTENHVVRKIDAATGFIETIAGNGTQGYGGDGGRAREAMLSSPVGVRADSMGNLYIADFGNHRVRLVEANSGKIRTIAGTGEEGYNKDGVPAVEAQLHSPKDIVLSADGTVLFIADRGNHRVRKVNLRTGIIETFAGDGTQGFSGDGGPATKARLNYPSRLALDEGGNLFVSDVRNHRIRKVDAQRGIISTVAGTGKPGYSGDGNLATNADLKEPGGITSGPGGTLIFTDSGNNVIRMVGPEKR
ncbi:MAG: hypothetical protein GMKNLPBB_02935 [Myxococcota bacterium]|nr:hypothetical protein [Myxococcota bacterium]